MSGKHGWHHDPSDRLRVAAGFSLADFDPGATPGWRGSNAQAIAEMDKRGADLEALQEQLFARGKEGDRRSVLLVIQGIDTAGKGGIVSHVVGLVNPMGVKITSFGVPTERERKHAYLWRIRNALPGPGILGVFDRSHYEQVLVVRVHDLVPRETWERYYDQLNAFEAKAAAAGTTVVKIALLVSPTEQLKRLEARLDDPGKYWKYKPKDLDERGYWNEYQAAYQAIFDRCSPATAPWFAIPADRKWYARLAVTEILATAMEGLGLTWPAATFDVAAEKVRIASLDPDAPEAPPVTQQPATPRPTT
jgi:PPK2 family polyphosphate:nucleotide phosphotransferase